MDLIRNILLWIEAAPQLDGTRELYLCNAEDMGIRNYSTVSCPSFCTTASERVCITKPLVQFAARREP
jgi:hypothetical protein